MSSLADEHRFQSPTNSGYVRLIHKNENFEFYQIRYAEGAFLLGSPLAGRFALGFCTLPFRTYFPLLIVRRKGCQAPTMASENITCEYRRTGYVSADPNQRFSVHERGGKWLVGNDKGDFVNLEQFEEIIGENIESIIQLIK